MTSAIHRICRIGPDGNVVVPISKDDAGEEVHVTIEPTRGSTRSVMTREEYRALIESISGKWVGDFPDVDDAPPEAREQF